MRDGLLVVRALLHPLVPTQLSSRTSHWTFFSLQNSSYCHHLRCLPSSLLHYHDARHLSTICQASLRCDRHWRDRRGSGTRLPIGALLITQLRVRSITRQRKLHCIPAPPLSVSDDQITIGAVAVYMTCWQATQPPPSLRTRSLSPLMRTTPDMN